MLRVRVQRTVGNGEEKMCFSLGHSVESFL